MQEMKMYRIREATGLLGKKVRTIREWIKLGRIKAVKSSNGRYWEIPATEIERMKEKGIVDEN